MLCFICENSGSFNEAQREWFNETSRLQRLSYARQSVTPPALGGQRLSLFKDTWCQIGRTDGYVSLGNVMGMLKNLNGDN